jgi:hypothetical protein
MKNVKTCWFGSAKWFWPGSFAEVAKEALQSLTFVKEECNKYDLIDTPCFLLINHNDWSKWFAISSLPPICSPILILWLGLRKNK